ncbi:MAG: nucleotide exchange factor GrpE [Bacilli bacterium]|nr:nucleotide exchange factor GrpE [Bacilli bacterium]
MEKEKCHCNDECTCGENCECTEDVKCSEDCHCGEDKCKCDDDCKCHEEEHECHCDHHDKKHDKKKHKEEKHKYKEIIEELKDELKKKDQEVLVAKADLINYRKRKDEEVVRMLKFCNEDLIKQILPIMDNFERAIKLDDDNLEDEVSKFLEGFKMIYCNMQNVMGNFEVKQIDGANKPFDPVYHNAIMVEQKEGVEPGMVIEVLQKGYIYKDKVIRPAMVKVSE